MCARCGAASDGEAGASSGGRLKLWEFTDNAHCPVIGTCLTHNDLLRVARGLRLDFGRDARDYDVHGYFVRAAITDSQEARALTKLLDERYAGAVRRVKRERCEERLGALWDEMKAGGQIAGGFWAFMTFRHVSPDLRSRVFGEVHMLSHLMGTSCRTQSAEAAALRASLHDLQRRRERAETSNQEALGARDAEIAALKREVAELRVRSSQPAPAAPNAIARRDGTAKLRRALDVARGRARAAEAENARLKRARSAARSLRLLPAEPAVEPLDRPTGADRERPIVANRLDGRSILYVGGRNGQMPHLQKIVETFGAALVHHDGGVEDAITRIDDVLPSVDCVFCPVDCVSHDACLRAKQGCKKLGKSFVPLRSASKACLRHALIAMIDADPSHSISL